MFRSRLMREGSVGLFFLLGIILFGGIIFFLKDNNLGGKNYQLKLLFENAGGLREGAKVYYRGVPVGHITAINPSSNGVEISTEIDNNLRIPKDVKISTLRSGLLGEVSVAVVPQSDLKDLGAQIDPFSAKCRQQQLILCDSEKINAKSTPDLVESLSSLTERINNQDFFDMINSTLDRVNKTSDKMFLLMDKSTVLVTQLNKDFKTITTTTEKIGNAADRIGNTADIANEQLDNLGNSYSNTAIELSILANNLNQLIDENKTDFRTAISNFSQTTAEVSRLVENTDKLVSKVSPDDVGKISKNLGTVTDNLGTASGTLIDISKELQNLSKELNNPTNLVALQQTLDSARVTFANTAKITSDIDEFTGDPEFRNNMKKLVNGLSSLVSYTETLEKQIELANLLEEVEKVTVKENKTILIEENPPLTLQSQPFPTVLSSKDTTEINPEINKKEENINPNNQSSPTTDK